MERILKKGKIRGKKYFITIIDDLNPIISGYVEGKKGLDTNEIIIGTLGEVDFFGTNKNLEEGYYYGFSVNWMTPEKTILKLIKRLEKEINLLE